MPQDPTLRKAAVGDGTLKILQPVRLSDFITIAPAGRLTRRRA
jgi:hypothetical protein